MNDLRITDKKYDRTFKAEKITALAKIMKGSWRKYSSKLHAAFARISVWKTRCRAYRLEFWDSRKQSE